MLTSIVILTHNQLKLTQDCLASIERHTRAPYEVIVVDNASTDGTVDYLHARPGIKLVANERNEGFAKGCNQGAAVAAGQQLLFLNNDTVVADGWLENMTRTLHAKDIVGMVGPVTNSCSGPQKIPVGYQQFSQLNDFAIRLQARHPGEAYVYPRLVGFCLLIKRKVWEEVGPFDERFGIGNYEDDDLCLRVIRAGYLTMIVRDSFVHHVGSATFNTMEEVNYWSLGAENRRKAAEKWGADIQTLLKKPLPSVSLCMVVREETAELEACLESLRFLIDEIVLVSTSGISENLRKLTSRYSGKVYESVPGSSDAPLTQAINQASCEYVLCLEPTSILDASNQKKLFQLKYSLNPLVCFVSMRESRSGLNKIRMWKRDCSLPLSEISADMASDGSHFESAITIDDGA